MRKSLVILLVLLACALPFDAWAGRVFGDIKIDGKPLPTGVQVRIARVVTTEGKPATTVGADTTATDEFGSYKLMVKEPGKCVLTVVYAKQTATLEVFSNKEATRYDLVLEQKEGKFTLRRK